MLKENPLMATDPPWILPWDCLLWEKKSHKPVKKSRESRLQDWSDSNMVESYILLNSVSLSTGTRVSAHPKADALIKQLWRQHINVVEECLKDKKRSGHKSSRSIANGYRFDCRTYSAFSWRCLCCLWTETEIRDSDEIEEISQASLFKLHWRTVGTERNQAAAAKRWGRQKER